jgi:hypothetical protein
MGRDNSEEIGEAHNVDSLKLFKPQEMVVARHNKIGFGCGYAVTNGRLAARSVNVLQ